MPLSNRPWSSRPNKSIHGVSYTQFADAFEIENENATLFDMFHGKCADYLDYFCKENPDWTPYVLMRDGWNSLIHAFAVKKQRMAGFCLQMQEVLQTMCLIFLLIFVSPKQVCLWNQHIQKNAAIQMFRFFTTVFGMKLKKERN